MDFLDKIITAYGPSGNEETAAQIIIEEIRDYVDEIRRDRLGNVIAVKEGRGTGKIMTAAHMDIIGVMVTSVDNNGFLRFTNVGYVDPYVAFAQNVVFENGIVGTIWREEKEKIKDLKLSELYIDIGASSKEDAGKIVNIGDLGVFKSEYKAIGSRLTSGSLDDRIGCYILVEAAKRMTKPESDVYFVFTVQEETYISGATTSAYSIEPDAAIAVDVTDTGDTPNCHTMSVEMGEGCAIKVMDRGLICHPKIKNYLVDCANKNNIKFQFEVLEAGATDGAAIHTTRNGVLTGVISIPSRYIHSPHEMVDMNDVEGAIKLLSNALQNYK